MWKSVVRDHLDMLEGSQNPNPLKEEDYDVWIYGIILQEPWLVALFDLVKWAGTWTGTEEQLMEEVKLRVNREVWESEDFPSEYSKLMEYFDVAWGFGRHDGDKLNLEIFDYHEVKKNRNLDEFDVPGWGPEAPILVEQNFLGRRPSPREAMLTLLHKYRSPLPLALLNFTWRHGGRKTRRRWSGGRLDLVEALWGCYSWPGDYSWPYSCPDLRPTPEDPESRETKRHFDEVHQKLDDLFRGGTDFRWLHRQMKTCAYIVKEVGITVSWKKEPRTVKHPEGNRKIEKTIWTIEAPYWSRSRVYFEDPASIVSGAGSQEASSERFKGR
jgi:hypothetical protein